MAPDDSYIKGDLEQKIKDLVVYDGIVQVPYRFHFDLLLRGNVLMEDRLNFTLAIQEEWTKVKPGTIRCFISY